MSKFIVGRACTAAAVAGFGFAAVSAATGWTGGTPPCGPAKVGGASVVTYCGPAKATVKFGGRTYRISNGKCSLVRAYGITAWSVNVGTQTLPPAKPKFLSFQGSLAKKPKAGTYKRAEFTLSFQLPGQSWVLAAGLPHKVTITAGAKKATFTGKFTPTNSNVFKSASGSWTC